MKKHALIILLITILVVCRLICDLPHNRFVVSFLDVGQGDAIYIRTPDDYQILIDGGPSVKILRELGEVMPLYNKNIDLLFLTHPHADHVNGLVYVLKKYNVKRIFIVGTPAKNAYYDEFLSTAGHLEIPVYFASAKEDMKVGKYLYIDIIWPFEKMAGVAFKNLNNASLSLRVLFKDQSIVLTGDAEVEQEEEMIESEENVRGNILKAGHHGSKTASSVNFLDAVTPETVVIQSGSGNSFGHPHKEILSRLVERRIEIRRNDMEGRIDFIFSLF